MFSVLFVQLSIPFNEGVSRTVSNMFSVFLVLGSDYRLSILPLNM